jgi:hypothetical protein
MEMRGRMVPQYISINDPVERADPGHRGDDVGDDRWSLSAAVASRANRKLARRALRWAARRRQSSGHLARLAVRAVARLTATPATRLRQRRPVRRPTSRLATPDGHNRRVRLGMGPAPLHGAVGARLVGGVVRPRRPVVAARTPRLPHTHRDTPAPAPSGTRDMITTFTTEVSGEPGPGQSGGISMTRGEKAPASASAGRVA